MTSKEMALSRYNDLLRLMKAHKKNGEHEVVTLYYNQCDGFLDGLFWGDVITDVEYLSLGKQLQDTYYAS